MVALCLNVQRSQHTQKWFVAIHTKSLPTLTYQHRSQLRHSNKLSQFHNVLLINLSSVTNYSTRQLKIGQTSQFDRTSQFHRLNSATHSDKASIKCTKQAKKYNIADLDMPAIALSVN